MGHRHLEFSPITLDRQKEYAAALRACPQLVTSDFAFANIWGWAEHYGLQWAFADDLVWLRQTRPEPICWAPIGPWDRHDWTRCCCMPEAHSFTRVPEYLALLWRQALGERVTLTEIRGHWDYVYAVPELIDLAGNRFHKKKNLLNQFLKNYEFEYRALDANCVEEVLEMQADWFSWYEEQHPSEALVAENRAIIRVLTAFDDIGGLTGATLRVNGKIMAYTVAEPLGLDAVVIHFEKADTRFKGAYQAINQLFLANEARKYTYVNREQDLDDEGLRKAKLSYNPALMLKKFKAHLA